MSKNQKQPLIFVSGFGTKHWMFQKCLNPLKNKFQLFIIDFSRPIVHKNININSFANLLHQFITDKKIKKPILVGHSFGGAVCLAYCLNFKNCQKIILLNPIGLLPLTYKNIIVSLWKINKSLLNPAGLKIIIGYLADVIFHFPWSIKKFRITKKIRFPEKQILKIKNFKIIFSDKDYLYPKKELRGLPKDLKLSIINGYHDWPVTEPQKFQKIINQNC